MVRDGFGDESGAKLIEQRGIDFAPSEDFIQTIKVAGAAPPVTPHCSPPAGLESSEGTRLRAPHVYALTPLF